MSNPKELRKQLRNVVKEILPEIMTQEQYELLKKHLDSRVKEIEEYTKSVLHEMNTRHKDTMGYLVRQASTPVSAPTTKKD